MWILLIFVHIGYGTAMDHIEGFQSQQSCLYAKSQFDKESFWLLDTSYSMCIEK